MHRHPEELRRRTSLSNTIYWITLLLLIFYLVSQLLFDFQNAFRYSTFDDWVPALLCAISVLSLILNRYQYSKASRTIFLFSWTASVTVLPVLLSKISPSSYLIHPILCVLTSLMIHLFFSWYEDRWIYLSFLIASFFLTSFSYYFLLTFDSQESFRQLPLNRFQFLIIYSMSWVFVNLTLMYVYRINWNAYKDSQTKNEIIEKLNRELESKVELRTKMLKEQNAKLIKYAFVNAHVLRAPVSRILGLVNLLIKSETPRPTEDKEIIEHLNESSKELDSVVRNLSVTLQESRDKPK